MNDEYVPDFTAILNRWLNGSDIRDEEDALIGAVYKELQKLAAGFMKNERVDHTLQPTALVNEVYLRLIKAENVEIRAKSHFFGIAANAMRQVLIDHARKYAAKKRGGDWRRLTLSSIENIGSEVGIDLLALDLALTKLEELDPRAASVATMRLFARMKVIEIAEELGLDPSTIRRDWRAASTLLKKELAGDLPSC